MTDKKHITATGKIIVNRNLESVFVFFANPVNDKLWRTEIIESHLDGTLQSGVLVSEYSYLSKKRPNNLLQLTCVLYDRNKIAVFETNDNAQFYLRSERRINAITDHTTEIMYALTFDSGIVKFALGFALPKFIISLKAKTDMKKYLKNLKTKLEHN